MYSNLAIADFVAAAANDAPCSLIAAMQQPEIEN
jgi:hypothetical protein